MMHLKNCLLLFLVLSSLLSQASNLSAAEPLKLLFLGDNGLHRPESRFQQIAGPFEQRGLQLRYTDSMGDLTPATLQQFDGLILYANIDEISDDQARTVLDYVAAGGGFVPLHCATWCWRNNADMVSLMGGQFLRHGARVFATQVVDTEHPLVQGFRGFTSWDETYIHQHHNEQNRTVLEYRLEGVQADGQHREPWTWVRTHGQGRVFYTAWGHDENTWSHPGFHNLLERGIRWACGDDPLKAGEYSDTTTFAAPAMTSLPGTDDDFEYVDVGPAIPNYTPGEKWGVQGKPRTTMQKPLPAESAMKHLVTPRGLAVRLYADERNFQAKPIAMTWDERGRLWVCETVDYPNEGGQNRDRIRICEDTDGDHRADRFTVFAEGLSIPTAIVIVRGGAVVQNGTETIYLKDTDGDDVADSRSTLISGWALGDTHGGVSNFRYGLDNWIWAMQGYNNSTPEVNGKSEQSFRMGFWRFRLSQTDPPQVTDLEFVRSSNNNTWGLGISEEGLIFGSTANHNPSMFLPISNRYYERVRGWAPQQLGTIADTYLFKPITEKVRQVDQFGGYTAAAGHALYTARTFPQQWWNRTAFVCGPTGHLVGTFVLRRNGADYSSVSPVNLLASDDEWSAPILAEVGPDGAVWVIDWYNYIVQHNPTPHGFETGAGNAYVSELRDKKHGRIYRVVPQSADGPGPAAQDIVHQFTSLAEMTDDQLVQVLTHSSMRWRLQAQRLLLERAEQRTADQVAALDQQLRALLADTSVDEVDLNVGAIHATHLLRDLNGLERAVDNRQAVETALQHPSAGVRRNAVLALHDSQLPQAVLSSGVLDDEDDQVRLQAILRLSDAESIRATSEVAQVAVVQLEVVTDPILLDAWTTLAAATANHYLTAVAGASQVSEPQLEVVRRVAEHVGRGRPESAQLAMILQALGKASPAVLTVLVEGLNAGLPVADTTAAIPALDPVFVELLQQAAPETRVQIIQLARRCGTSALDDHVAELIDALSEETSDESRLDADRIAAARQMIQLQPTSADVVSVVVDQLTAQASLQLGQELLQLVSLSRAEQAGLLLVERLPELTPELRSSALKTLLSRQEWLPALLAGFAEGEVSVGDLSLSQRETLRSWPDETLRKEAQRVLAMGSELPDANRERVLQSLLPIVQNTGDVAAGKALFKQHCSKCHRHGEMGTAIGPNLTGMAVHPKAELLTHIIDPSRSVEGNFRLYTVVRTDGRVSSGMLAAETRTSITLVDTEAKRTSIPRSEIDELVASRKSLMPEGFEKQMRPEELTNLLEFLTFRGRYMPLSLDRYATAISTRGLFHEGDSGPDRLVLADWQPREVHGVPFVFTDPAGKSRPNIVLLNGPLGTRPPEMPQSVTLDCHSPAAAIHLLSGVGGWNYPAHGAESVSMIVRLHYADGQQEDHPLKNGLHFADYIRRVDVEGSQFAFAVGSQQMRYLSITPGRQEEIAGIELRKGEDLTAPIVMAVTVER